VAKSYKAEKLYSSLRSDFSFQSPETLNRIVSATGIGEIANDIRAREWQRCHNDLRNALNKILSDSPLYGNEISATSRTSAQQRALAGLLAEFRSCYDEERKFVDQSIDTLLEAGKREEFGHVLKLSLELIRAKSRAQAAKAVADELNSVLQLSNSPVLKNPQDAISPSQIKAAQPQEQIDELPRNVIPLRRKVG
jgi:hypothetical protein